MTYSLISHTGEAVEALAEVLEVKTACNIVEELKGRGCDGLRLDIDDGDISVRLNIVGIKDPVVYFKGAKPQGD